MPTWKKLEKLFAPKFLNKRKTGARKGDKTSPVRVAKPVAAINTANNPKMNPEIKPKYFFINFLNLTSTGNTSFKTGNSWFNTFHCFHIDHKITNHFSVRI